jgi:hypothetical protein
MLSKNSEVFKTWKNGFCFCLATFRPLSEQFKSPSDKSFPLKKIAMRKKIARRMKLSQS